MIEINIRTADNLSGYYRVQVTVGEHVRLVYSPSFQQAKDWAQRTLIEMLAKLQTPTKRTNHVNTNSL